MQKLLALLFILGFSQFALAESFTLNSSSVANNSSLSALYTCDGKDVSPQFSWKNAPAKTQSFAIILSDPDAPSGLFYHWLVYNISKDTQAFPEGISSFPTGTLQGKNTFGKNQYKGPCPPKGSVHHYQVSLYALDNLLNLAEGASAEELEQAMKSHVLSTATYGFTYSH